MSESKKTLKKDEYTELHDSKFEIHDVMAGGTVARYLHDRANGNVALQLIPKSRLKDVVIHRDRNEGFEFRHKTPPSAMMVGSLAHFHVRGEQFPNSSPHGLRNTDAVRKLRFVSREETVNDESGKKRHGIITRLVSDERFGITHELSWYENDEAFFIETTFTNLTQKPVILEFITSFSLDNLSPFHSDDASGDLFIHRYRSGWSAEGHHIAESAEHLHLENSWAGFNTDTERFGALGTRPSTRWFPFVAVEDRAAKVFWGAQLYTSGSWQMQIGRTMDTLGIDGGLADYEFGHWAKTINPGESFCAPQASVAAVSGTLDDLGNALVRMQEHGIGRQPEAEKDLPILYNEFCLSWGKPDAPTLASIAQRFEGSDLKCLVIDAGWSKKTPGFDNAQWSNGDWEDHPVRFPEGLRKTAEEIRTRGMIPGLWYEFEVTTIGARVHGPEFDEQHLKRDGMILESRSRRWFDFRQKWVWDYIDRVMVDKLRADGFGYLKIDYNGNAGFGCDGAESAGEGMRQHTDAVIAYLRHVREIFPELIIENCASGGHRLAPAWLTASDQSSFSDAHECREIPLIAARLHHLILPRQSQIWATLHADDTPERLYYSFAATFLGRMCISGEVTTLDAGRWAIVTEAMAFYRKIVPIIRNGRSKYTNRTGESMRHPKGDQALIRFGCSQVEDGNFTCDDADEALIIQHSFEDPHQDPIVFELPPSKGGWAMVGQFNPHGQAAIKRDQIALAPLPSWEGAVFHLRRK